MRVFVFFVFTLSCSAAPHVLAFEAREHGYVSHGDGYSLTVTPASAVMNVNGHGMRMSLVHANPTPRLTPLERMPGKANYFFGRDVRASYDLFGRVRACDVYEGIDLLFRGNQEHLEYDFEIAPRRDPRTIQLAFDGVDRIHIDTDGSLVLGSGEFEIHEPRPDAYQGSRKIPVAYVLDTANHVRFRLGRFDRRRPLIIDPQIVFQSFFGGSGTTNASGIALDAKGNIYVAGQTNSADFPVVNAAQSHPGAAPLLSSADGGQSWSNPALGPASLVRSIASSPTAPNVLYAATGTGVIRSTDGGSTWTVPANNGLTAQVSVLAVDAGSASTVYAGSLGHGIFTSTDGGANWTQSTSGLIIPNSTPPITPQFLGLVASPSQAGTVFAIASFSNTAYRSTDFAQTWTQLMLPMAAHSPEALAFNPSDPNTFFLGQQNGAFLTSSDGGNTWTALSNQNVATAQGLALLPANPAVLLASDQNGIARSSDGGNTWSVVLVSGPTNLAADPRNAGVVYALNAAGLYRSNDSGQTWSSVPVPYEVSPSTVFVSPMDSRVFVGQGTQTDAFVTKYSSDGKTILYSTYLGGSQNDSATGVAVDSNGNAYVTGMTNSHDFPVTKNAFQQTLSTLKGNALAQNAFVTKLSTDGSQLVYSTLIGAGSEATSRIAVNGAGEALIAGGTFNSNFPTTTTPPPVAVCPIQSPFVQTSGMAFVSKIAADGESLVFSTLFGGSCGTRGQAVAYDANGNEWVGGWTDSPNFPVTNDALQSQIASPGGYDGFLVRFNPIGTMTYATYLGGPGYDTVEGIAFDPKGNVYLTGTSGGLQQPASTGAFLPKVTVGCVIFSFGPGVYQATGSGFVLKLDSGVHNTLGLTYLGSPLCLYPSDIAVDAAGEPWIAGPLSIYGSSPQTMAPFRIGVGNGFVSKFSADFTQLLYSTYFDTISGVALDSAGLAYVGGEGYVAKIDPTPPVISLDSVQNTLNPASPSNLQGISAGELLRIIGKNMGPAQTAAGIINNGMLANSVAGVQVTFDGAPVPLLSVSATEIDLVAPFEIADKTSTTIQVQYNNVKSNAVQVGVASTTQFVAVQSGIPVQVLGIFNDDMTYNSASNPAQAGSVMSMYVSGVGQSVPPSKDGQINTLPWAGPPGPVQILLTSMTVPITFAGAAPDLVAGIYQINFVAPQTTSVPFLTIGPAQTTFKVFVQ